LKYNEEGVMEKRREREEEKLIKEKRAACS